MDRDVEMMHGPPISYSNNNADDLVQFIARSSVTMFLV